MSAETAEVLRRARALIADPEHWCRRVLARTSTGDVTGPDGDNARQWCAMGALARITPHYQPALDALYAAAEGRPIGVNDNRGHAAVLEMYDRAIALAEAEV